MLREARRRGRTARTGSGEVVLLRADDVEAAHADARFANPGVANLEQLGISDGPFYQWRKRSLAALEGQEHKRLRSFIGGLFTPRLTEKLREDLRIHAETLLDAALREGQIEIVSQYASELPLWGICRFLGIPEDDRQEIAEYLVGTEEAFSTAMTPEIRARADRSILALYDHAERLIERQASKPGKGAISRLLAARTAADDIPDEDFLALVVNLIGGAVGSTRSAISNGIFLLLSHPAQARLVREQAEQLVPAVEECLRYSPPFRVGRRVALTPLHAFGVELARGDSVFISRAAANRDPARFERPDTFDITRPPQPHSSFGHGSHFCLGQALARVEIQEAIRVLCRRFPEAELITRQPERIPFTMDEQLRSLAVRL